MKIAEAYRFVFLILSVTSLYGCRQQTVTKQELSAYVSDDDNGLHKKKEIGQMTMDISYKPQDMILAQEVEGSNYTSKQRDSIKNRLDQLDYFTLKLSYNNQELANINAADPAMFNSTMNYLSFEIGNDIQLVHGMDSIPVNDFMYFRGYGLTQASEVLLVFESFLKKRDGKVQVIYNDEFFHTGLSQFEFSIDNIKSIPSLAINK